MTEELYAGKVGNPGRPMTVIEGGEGTPIPEAPLSWAANSNAREMWQRLWTVGRKWLSNEAHYDLMRILCEATEDRDKLRRRMKREAMIVTGSGGQPQSHPGYRELDAMEGKIARLLDQAGFSPAKQRMQVAPAKAASKLDEIRAASRRSGAG
jgi:P27 family predicted phage terminase small subunit